MSKIYAIDFDGTLCESKYPDIGEAKKDLIDYVKGLKNDGNELILWTCRTNENLENAISWCQEQGIEFDAVNENLQSSIDLYGGDTRKVFADYYIDDKAVDSNSITSSEGGEKMSKTLELKQRQMWEFKQAKTEGELDLYVYGDIEDIAIDWVEYAYVQSENSAKHFKEVLDANPDVKQINVYVNSNGGYVMEAMSIRNQLKRHPANVTGFVDGFACSAASFILTGCDEVKMYSNTMQMIHNMWSIVIGNANEMRKAADDLDVIMKGNRQAYLEKAGDKLTEDKLIEMLDSEKWLTAQECFEIGLCDEVIAEQADLTSAKAMLQKSNIALAQHIEFNKSLVAQLKELSKPVVQVETVPAEPIDEQKDEPKQNETIKFLSALRG